MQVNGRKSQKSVHCQSAVGILKSGRSNTTNERKTFEGTISTLHHISNVDWIETTAEKKKSQRSELKHPLQLGRIGVFR